MKQRGWALIGVILVCALMASATLTVWSELASLQMASAQRTWLLHSKAAAQALILETQAAWAQAPPAPDAGCVRGRCAWQGDAGLAKAHWPALWANAAQWGSFTGSNALSNEWPTLPGSRLYCWLETTPSPDGVLVRITAWVQGKTANASTVMQALWLSSPGGDQDGWVSWREVMP